MFLQTKPETIYRQWFGFVLFAKDQLLYTETAISALVACQKPHKESLRTVCAIIPTGQAPMCVYENHWCCIYSLVPRPGVQNLRLFKFLIQLFGAIHILQNKSVYFIYFIFLRP